MVKIKVKAGKEAVEGASSDSFGDPPKPGLYHLRLESVEKKTTQGTKDRYYLNCRWQPVGAGREGTKLDKKVGSVWDTVSLSSEATEWKRAQFALALGAKPDRAGNVNLDVELDSSKPGSPVGTVCLGRVRAGKDLNEDYKAEIGWVGPLTANGEDSDAFEDEEEEASEPFDEDEEVEGDDDLLTEEQLADMDPKELGALAKEFDLKPAEYVVKTRGKTDLKKSSAKLIAAILEAQNGEEVEEGDEEEDDSDNPF